MSGRSDEEIARDVLGRLFPSHREPGVIGEPCKRGLHDWCANRNHDECHCSCTCHEKRHVGKHSIALVAAGRAEERKRAVSILDVCIDAAREDQTDDGSGMMEIADHERQMIVVLEAIRARLREITEPKP